MASGQGGKREEIRGTTSRDIMNINNNFKWLWNYVFGNINFTDINSSVLNKLAALQNSVNGFLNLLNQHKDDTTIHTNTTEKSYWNNHVMDNSSHVTSADKANWNNHKDDTVIHVTSSNKTSWDSKASVLSATLTNATNIIGVVDCVKIGNIVNLNGALKNNTGAAITGETTISTLPTGYRPTTNIYMNLRTSLGLAKLNIYSTGEVKIDLTSTTGYIASLTNLADVFLYGITFKGA